MDSVVTSELYEELIRTAVPSKGRNYLIILVGLPYAGKSTVSGLLADRGFVHVWATVIKKRYNMKSDEEMLGVAEVLCERLLDSGYGVVFDFLNHRQVTRDRFIAVAKRTNRDYRIVYLNTDKNEIFRRQAEVMKQSSSSLGRSRLSKEVVEIISEEFQELDTRDPHVIEVRNGDVTKLVNWLNILG